MGGLARMIIATLGGPKGCQRHLERMMKLVEPFMHPSNESSHTLLVLVFLQNLLQEMVNRYKEERVKKNKRKVPQTYYLTDDDIAKFTDTILPSLLYALYAKDSATSKTPPKLVMILCALCPGRVLPKVLEHIYSAIFAVDEPHRLTQTLNCLFELVFLIAEDSSSSPQRSPVEKNWIWKMEEIRSPNSPVEKYSLSKLNRGLEFNIEDYIKTYRCHLFYILEMLIEAIDINDVNKANIAIQNITLIFYVLPILDYSDCIKYHDLTEDEKALCKLSARLPILAEMALDRMLNIIQCLSVTAPKDSSSVIGSFKDLATKEGSEEKVLKKAIDRCVAAIFKNADDPITSELPSIWISFAEHVLRNLRIVLTPDVMQAEDLDVSASWFVSLASSLLSTTSENYIQYKDICFEMIDLLVKCKSKVAYISGAQGLWNSLYRLSRVYPESSRYMALKLNRPLKEWVPIRSELLTATEEQNEIFAYLTDPIKRELPAYVYGAMAYVCHMVRLAAQTELFLVFAEYTISREAIVDSIISVLADKNSTKEKIKGALIVIWKSKLAINSTTQTRIKIWQALLEMKECKQLMAYCDEMFEKLHKTGEWVKFNSKDYVEMTFKKKAERKKENKRQQELLVNMLLNQFGRKDLLHTRLKLCRTMLWRCQMDEAGLETIKILLSKLTDEEQLCREKSAEELAYWLKKNKVRTVRMDWKCPKNVQGKIPLRCGIRPDNMGLAYDSENLPNTEEKWNNTVFFSKQFGCYKWPESISVVVFAKQPQIKRPELNECEKAIVATFEDSQMFCSWIKLLLIEKKDLPELKESTVWIVKRAHQRLAAEIFGGIAMGTKYRGFKVLNDLWTKLSHAVDLMYDYMNADAYNSWSVVLTQVLHRDDTRRYWWLIEEFLKGMNRRAPTAWHRAIRLLALTADQWREVETRRRICEIAWRKLPKAKIETQRVAISIALKNICVLLDANMNNNFKDLPKRFNLESVDYWLQRFENNLGESASTKSGQSSAQASETSLTQVNPPGVSLSEVIGKLEAVASATTVVDKSQIYLRTLLEFLLQYYENCITCLTPSIISLFPVLLEYANEDDAEYVLSGSLKDMDIKLSANTLIHDYMSSLLLTPKFADSFLNVVTQMEVRMEASRAMLTLILCDYMKLDKELTNYLNGLMKSKSTAALHGAILGMAAVVRAHPFSTPPAVKPVLRALCGVTSHSAELQVY
ncbi:unnamed protein product [Haemonchus placei]|uniref:Proteasome activator Blm10 mid region domain-containing protein n=1 Tax=Haemonchus placei TaxID=6290 RepID=A0A3P7WEB9_HAEPC|nr:unnamed protein product [Haemonchus placei]